MLTWFRRYIRKISIWIFSVEFHPPTEDELKDQPPQPPKAATPAHGDDGDGIAFGEAVAALQKLRPDILVGATAIRGQYFERARLLTNYRIHEGNSSSYAAVQKNGRIMWLYISNRANAICCGDK